MRRRDLVAVLGFIASIRPANAAEIGVRVAFISPQTPEGGQQFVSALAEGLRRSGLNAQEFVIDARFAHGRIDDVPRLIAASLESRSQVIVVGGTTPAQLAKDRAGETPVVFVGVSDPVGSGLVQSLARPGGNITGLSTANEEGLASKWFELLLELRRGSEKIIAIYNPQNRSNAIFLDAVRSAATARNTEVVALRVQTLEELSAALAGLRDHRADGVIVVSDPFLVTQRATIVSAVRAASLPSVFAFGEYVREGGLISYGASLSDMYKQAGRMVARIVQGTRPSELPVEQPSVFELVINLKAAKALDLTIPPTLLARADEVIE